MNIFTDKKYIANITHIYIYSQWCPVLYRSHLSRLNIAVEIERAF